LFGEQKNIEIDDNETISALKKKTWKRFSVKV
jgi:hypothetical protein